MTIYEFKEKLEIIYQTLYSKELQKDNVTYRSYFDLIELFTIALTNRKYSFLSFQEDNDDKIEFTINSRSEDLFMVRKNEMYDDKDPIPYIRIDEDWISYEFSLATLLLTEYVDWLSENEENKFELQFSGYGIYVPIKEHWTQLFNPFSYPNKIWISKEIKSVILIQNEISTLKCIASDSESLKSANDYLSKI